MNNEKVYCVSQICVEYYTVTKYVYVCLCVCLCVAEIIKLYLDGIGLVTSFEKL